MNSSDTRSAVEPAFASVADVAIYTGESEWTVREKLRLGRYLAKKSGRRTIVDMASVRKDLAELPDAKFAKSARAAA